MHGRDASSGGPSRLFNIPVVFTYVDDAKRWVKAALSRLGARVPDGAEGAAAHGG